LSGQKEWPYIITDKPTDPSEDDAKQQIKTVKDNTKKIAAYTAIVGLGGVALFACYKLGTKYRKISQKSEV